MSSTWLRPKQNAAWTQPLAPGRLRGLALVPVVPARALLLPCWKHRAPGLSQGAGLGPAVADGPELEEGNGEPGLEGQVVQLRLPQRRAEPDDGNVEESEAC